MKVNILNSSGKSTGEIDILPDKILIRNGAKPELIIEDPVALKIIADKDKSAESLLYLYDSFMLMVGEIAALYGVTYSNINKIMKELTPLTPKMGGRRNSSFGTKFGPKRLANMSAGAKEFFKTHDGPNKGVPMKEDQKRLISATLKKKYATGELVQDPEKKRAAWIRGCYDHVDFKRGIGGFFYSLKNQKRFIFRSLLELYYFLQLEEREDVISYIYEPLRIMCDNGSTYTPDILLNESTLIELKSYKYVHRQPVIQDKFEYKCQQAILFCQNNPQYTFEVVWDMDIGFDSRRMKAHLKNNPNLIIQYQIEFFDKNRVGL